MKVAVFACGLYFLAFAGHWLVWRIRIPNRQTASLLVCFLTVLAAGLSVVQVSSRFEDLRGFWRGLHITIFHVAMTLAYVVVYSALEGQSPSMTVLIYVAGGGENGRTRAEIATVLKDAVTVEGRMAAMGRDNLVVAKNSAYCLTRKGRVWAIVFSYWRTLSRLPTGG